MGGFDYSIRRRVKALEDREGISLVTAELAGPVDLPVGADAGVAEDLGIEISIGLLPNDLIAATVSLEEQAPNSGFHVLLVDATTGQPFGSNNEVLSSNGHSVWTLQVGRTLMDDPTIAVGINADSLWFYFVPKDVDPDGEMRTYKLQAWSELPGPAQVRSVHFGLRRERISA